MPNPDIPMTRQIGADDALCGNGIPTQHPQGFSKMAFIGDLRARICRTQLPVYYAPGQDYRRDNLQESHSSRKNRTFRAAPRLSDAIPSLPATAVQSFVVRYIGPLLCTKAQAPASRSDTIPTYEPHFRSSNRGSRGAGRGDARRHLRKDFCAPRPAH